MADLTPIYDALRQADAAGDTESVQKLSAYLQSQQPHHTQSFDSLGNGQTVPTGSPEAHAAQSPLEGMDAGQRMYTGVGKSFVDTGRGLGQLVGAESPQDVQNARDLDAPLNHDAAALVGQGVGGVAQAVLPAAGGAKLLSMGARAAPGLVRALTPFVAAAAPEIGGATMGAAQPAVDSKERLRNAALGAATMGAGQELGSAIGAGTDAVPKVFRDAFDLAQKYGIDLRLPQLTNSKMAQHFSNLTDALPFSGAGARSVEQRAQFNDAISRESGIQPTGAITPDHLDAARDKVGSTIGAVVGKYSAIPTTTNMSKMMQVLQDARTNAMPDVQEAVESKLKQLFTHVDPQTGQIPGTAWRQANTALNRQINQAYKSNGDLGYYLDQIHDNFMDMMEQGMPAADKAVWDQARGQYRNIKSIQPLVEKGGNAGVAPALLRQRLIASGNNRGNLSDLADIGQENLKLRVPDSGTGQKWMLGELAGLGGAGAAGVHAGLISEPHALGTAALSLIGNRALNSKLAAQYYMARLPKGPADIVDAIAGRGIAPAATQAGVASANQAHDDLDQAAHSGALADKPPQNFSDLSQ